MHVIFINKWQTTQGGQLKTKPEGNCLLEYFQLPKRNFYKWFLVSSCTAVWQGCRMLRVLEQNSTVHVPKGVARRRLTHPQRIHKQTSERESGAESDSVQFAPREQRRISDFSYLSCACVAVSLALVPTAQQLSSLTFIICGWCCKWLSSVVFIATVCFWGGSWPSSTHTHRHIRRPKGIVAHSHSHTQTVTQFVGVKLSWHFNGQFAAIAITRQE